MNQNDEWYTPEYVLNLAREVLGTIHLDPASSDIANERVNAEIYFTKEDNGLSLPWEGTVWCNPPYSAALIKKYCNKVYEEYSKGHISEAIVLTNSGTDTLWNQPLAKGTQVYTLGRISFLTPEGSEKGKGGRGQCFTYFGSNHKKFIEVFTRNNFCWCPNQHLIRE